MNRSELYEEVVKACNYILHNDDIANNARTYIDTRLTKNLQNKYEFGFFPSDNCLQNLTSLVDKSILIKLNLIYPKYISGGAVDHGQFNQHNLVMPFRDAYGNIIAILGRTLLDVDEYKIQKYKYSYDAKKNMHVYGLNTSKQYIIDNDFVICLEGQFDYIACFEAGIKNIGALGWANMTRYQFFALHKYTNNFVLLLDNDDAGRKGSVKIKRRYSKYANIIAPKFPSEYKDIDECLSKDKDKKAVVNWLENIL